jgi:hypothetical protein
MRKLTIGDVTITSIIERDGPWRAPAAMFPKAAGTPELLAQRLREVEPETYDHASGKMVITYQTYVTTRSWSIPAQARTRAIRLRWTFPNSHGWTG